MDIEILRLRLEEVQQEKVNVAEEKRATAEKLLEIGLESEVRTILLENSNLLVQRDMALNDLKAQYEKLIECRLFHNQYRHWEQ